MTSVHADARTSAQEFHSLPVELVGMVQSVSTPAQYVEASITMSTEGDGLVTVVLYTEPTPNSGLMTPADGMWRAAILSLAQRALTHGHRVTVTASQSRVNTAVVWIAANLTINKS
jgi:hypothetical protein